MGTLTQSRGSQLSSRIRRNLLVDLANLRDGKEAISWFWRKHRSIDPASPQDATTLRDELGGIWLDPSHGADKTLDKWLGWRPSQEVLAFSYALRGLRAPGKNAPVYLTADEISELQGYLRQTEADHLAGLMAFNCSIKARRLLPNNCSLRSNLIQGVFENWHHFRCCANPDCLAPYFIAKRSDQTVCDASACKAEKQREHARKWWNENRAKRVETKAPKGRLKHGSSKTP